MNDRTTRIFVALLVCSVCAFAQPTRTFEQAAAGAKADLDRALQELAELREQIGVEQLPLLKELSDLETELTELRREHTEKSRELTKSALDVSNLQDTVKKRKADTAYLAKLLGDYVAEFGAGLHITEVDRFEPVLKAAQFAAENTALAQREVFDAQAAVLETSVQRLDEALGGAIFSGTAVDANGIVKQGRFLLVGPSALFVADDGSHVGTAEQKVDSFEPTALTFPDPADGDSATALLAAGTGVFPFDPSGGKARQVAEAEETLWEHIQKGGPVMVPIFAMAGLALLIALYKWVGLAFIRRPARKLMARLLDAISRADTDEATAHAARLRGPTGRMLRDGVEHMHEPRDLVEEVMYERILTTKLRLQRMLPFIAISAASAPLLGLLGTVSGIINTFKMITLNGAGDVKSLSGGISEALITTKFGLIVAIPSLLLHAFLSRKARGVVSQMETAAVAFINRLGKLPSQDLSPAVSEAVRDQVQELIIDILGPIARAPEVNLSMPHVTRADTPRRSDQAPEAGLAHA